MDKRLKVSDVMIALPHTVGPKITLQRAKELMTELNVRHLPVQHGGKLIGIITDRDINFAVAVDKKDPQELCVEDAFTAEPYVVDPDTSLAEVADKMANDYLGCALVAKNGDLLGIFTTVDACRVLAEQLN